MKERRALIVYADPAAQEDSASLTELNALLNSGWTPMHVTGMGGAGSGTNTGEAESQHAFAALVLLQRDTDRAVTGFGGS